MDFSFQFSYYSPRPASAYQSWISSFSLSGVDATDQADPDHDGRPNMWEYCLGGNPADAKSMGASPFNESAGSSLKFVYSIRNQALDEFTLALESSTTLQPGDWVDLGLPITEMKSLGTGFSEFKSEIPIDVPRKFIRLKITKKQN